MKKKWIIAILAGVVTVGALGGLTAYGQKQVSEYLKDKYAPNTWINGNYVTGLSASEVNQELLADLEAPSVTVSDAEGNTYSYDLKQAGYQYDYYNSLDAYQKQQNANGWKSAISQENVFIPGEPEFTYDEASLKAWWDELPVVKAEEAKPKVEIKLDEDGYALVSNLDHHLDVDKGLSELVNAISERNDSISLSECYFDYQMDEDQKTTYQNWQELKAMEKCGLTYDMGDEQIKFDESIMSKLIARDKSGNPVKDENGKYYYDLDAVDAFVEELCEKYHTYGVERPFQTSRETKDVVMVQPGNFGTEIDAKKEKEFVREILSNDLTRMDTTVHKPTYLHETLHRGLDDLGGTYVEVDLTNQMVYFYVDYELKISSGVVTGNLRTKHDTPEGAWCVQWKTRNRYLMGGGTPAFVRWWMPIYKGIGMHDARWRKKTDFDDPELYKTSGSHGCINMPDETAETIYNNVVKGTPVFVYK